MAKVCHPGTVVDTVEIGPKCKVPGPDKVEFSLTYWLQKCDRRAAHRCTSANFFNVRGHMADQNKTSGYEAPQLVRLGTLRELTQAGGDFSPGDGANPYHRYAP